MCRTAGLRWKQAVGWIKSAGGSAVIAHPGRYKFSPVAEGALFDEFKQLGGTAIEVVTGSHTPDQYPDIRRTGPPLWFSRLARHGFPCAGRIARRFCPAAAAAERLDADLARLVLA